MSNELERKLLLYDQFKREQWSQETQKLRDIIKLNTLVAWAAMTKKQQVKSYLAVVVDEEEVWSVDIVKAVYCSCMQEIECLHVVRSDEAFDVLLNLVRGIVFHNILLFDLSLDM